jgi:hypothetical protein
MKLLDIHQAALRRADDARLQLHMRRLDRTASRRGYRNARLDAAETQRVAEVWRRKSYEEVLSAAHAIKWSAWRDLAQAELVRRQAEPRSAGADDTDKGAG